MTGVVANLSWMVPGGIGGSEEYTTRLLRAVAASPPLDVALELVGPSVLTSAHPDLVAAFPTRTFPGPVGIRPYRLAVESTWLPRATRSADLVHHFGGRVPARRSAPAVVTIHDIQPLDLPANFGRLKRRYLAAALPRSAEAARLVCTPSKWSADRIVARFGLDGDRVRVVPSTWDDRPRPTGDDDPLVRLLADRPVIVYPAMSHRHKNHDVLVRILPRLIDRHAGLRLVLTGAAGDHAGPLAAAIARLPREARAAIVRPGRVPDVTLRRLIGRADVLVFPSRYEAFGLPVLEAMHASTPVVVAAATALPEVVADAGLTVAPDDTDGWYQAIDCVLTDSTRRADMVAAGRRRCMAFAPALSAAKLVDAWRAAAD